MAGEWVVWGASWCVWALSVLPLGIPSALTAVINHLFDASVDKNTAANLAKYACSHVVFHVVANKHAVTWLCVLLSGLWPLI